MPCRDLHGQSCAFGFRGAPTVADLKGSEATKINKSPFISFAPTCRGPKSSQGARLGLFLRPRESKAVAAWHAAPRRQQHNNTPTGRPQRYSGGVRKEAELSAIVYREPGVQRSRCKAPGQQRCASCGVGWVHLRTPVGVFLQPLTINTCRPHCCCGPGNANIHPTVLYLQARTGRELRSSLLWYIHAVVNAALGFCCEAGR